MSNLMYYLQFVQQVSFASFPVMSMFGSCPNFTVLNVPENTYCGSSYRIFGVELWQITYYLFYKREILLPQPISLVNFTQLNLFPSR